MSNYTKSTNFASKDSLASGNPLKIVKGTEINTEFDNISTAIATKLDSTSGALTTPTLPAGTAQSLLFLNSSKVITTDADLTYTPSSDLFLLTGITLQIANGSALSSLDGITVSSNGKAVTGNADNVADAGTGGYFIGNQYGIQVRAGTNSGGVTPAVAADIKNTVGFSSAAVVQIDQAGSFSSGSALKITVSGGSSTSKAIQVVSGDSNFADSVLITGAGSLGYTTGSGGAVTQATSRTTGVTLNKTNGAITLVSAAGSTSWQSFTVTNSKVSSTDTVIVNQKSGTDLYQIFVTNVGSGSFKITFATTGGTTTEQPVFNFAVIKAATS